jgi:hypothetical protein
VDGREARLGVTRARLAHRPPRPLLWGVRRAWPALSFVAALAACLTLTDRLARIATDTAEQGCR